jgi:hypothetical protein
MLSRCTLLSHIDSMARHTFNGILPQSRSALYAGPNKRRAACGTMGRARLERVEQLDHQAWAERARGLSGPLHDAFGDTGTTCQELAWKTQIFSGRAAPISPPHRMQRGARAGPRTAEALEGAGDADGRVDFDEHIGCGVDKDLGSSIKFSAV